MKAIFDVYCKADGPTKSFQLLLKWVSKSVCLVLPRWWSHVIDLLLIEITHLWFPENGAIPCHCWERRVQHILVTTMFFVGQFQANIESEVSQPTKWKSHVLYTYYKWNSCLYLWHIPFMSLWYIRPYFHKLSCLVTPARIKIWKQFYGQQMVVS